MKNKPILLTIITIILITFQIITFIIILVSIMTKRHREAINIETKYQILKLVAKGEKYSNIMKEFNLKNKANISVILKQKEEIMKAFEERNLCN